jgi:hypothetical protein
VLKKRKSGKWKTLRKSWSITSTLVVNLPRGTYKVSVDDRSAGGRVLTSKPVKLTK